VTRAASWMIAGAVMALQAVAQDPASRIDDTPRVVFRPSADGARPLDVRLPAAPLEDARPETRSDRDRRIDLDLEVKDRRDALEGRDDGLSHWLALAAFVVGSAAILVAYLMFVARRRG
jgi:hypothetical protein